jgi:hypothetical protein
MQRVVRGANYGRLNATSPVACCAPPIANMMY